MIRFSSDYVQGAHPQILAALAETNQTQYPGYGQDALCEEAAALLKNLTNAPDADVHFVPGGTQANLLVLCAALRPHQAAIAAQTGHISVHEAGAIEAAGHKVIELASSEGKLRAAQVESLLAAHRADPVREHTVQPKLCYISHPTEYGTLYSREELAALSRVCRAGGAYLYLDGARLGYALASGQNDADLAFLAECCDAFTVGGTKLGALFGEAIVVNSRPLRQDFRYIQKQRGAMLAKGWLIGLQFAALLKGGSGCLYLQGARHALRLAGLLAASLQQRQVPLLMPPATNQIFPVLPNAVVRALRAHYTFDEWETVDDAHTAVRFCTAWSTPPQHVEALLGNITAQLAAI